MTKYHHRIIVVGAIGVALSGLLSVPAQAATPGIVITQVTGGASTVSLDVFPDGSVGVVATRSDDRIVVLKHTPSGRLNTSFGSNGVATLDIPGKANAAAIAVRGDGTIVVAGTVDRDVLVARLTASGKLDTHFNNIGYRKTDLGGADEQATGVALGGAGEVFLLATIKGTMAVVRYKANGEIDSSYGVGGVAKVDIAGTATSKALAVRRTGRVVAVGTVGKHSDTDESFLMAQFDPRGRLDGGFGADGSGTVVINSGAAIRSGPVMVLDGTERVVVGGNVGGEFAVARYTSAGRTDRDFGRDGLGKAGLKGTATKLAVRGKDITVAGVSGGKAAVVRFAPDGKTLNDNYGRHGVVTTSLGSKDDSVAGVVVDSAGRAIIAGTTDGKIAVARFTTTGKLDENFRG